MGAPVVKSTNGYGLPVTVVASGGLPVALADNGYGTPIIEVAQGGLPITYDQGGGAAGISRLIASLSQSNEAGGHTAANGGALLSPDDDPVARSKQVSPNGGGAFPAQWPQFALVQDDMRGNGRYANGVYATNPAVNPAHGFAKKAVVANPNDTIVTIPGGVGGTDMSEYRIGASIPSGWPKNRWNMIRDAFLAQMAIDPSTTWYAFTACILENEIGNNRGSANVPDQIANYVADFRALGGEGADSAPFLLSTPQPEWLGNDMAKWDYLINAHKAAVALPNVGIVRAKRGDSVTTDIIHKTNTAQRRFGGERHDIVMPRAIALQTTPPLAPVVNLPANSDMLEITSDLVPYHEIFVRNDPGLTGPYTKFEMVPFECNMPGEILRMPIPLSGTRQFYVVSKSRAGDSPASAPITFTVPTDSLPSTYIETDIDNASVDGSQNVISLPSIGTNTTAWIPQGSGGTTGAAALLKRQLIGSSGRYGLVLDNAAKYLLASTGQQAGDYTMVAAVYIPSTALNGALFSAGVSTYDIHWGGANSGLNTRINHNSSSVQLLSTDNPFLNNIGYWGFFALTYNRAGNLAKEYMNDKIILQGAPTQRAASPVQTGGSRILSGFAGATLALPFKTYPAELTLAQLSKIKAQYAADYGVTFGVLPAKAA